MRKVQCGQQVLLKSYGNGWFSVASFPEYKAIAIFRAQVIFNSVRHNELLKERIEHLVWKPQFMTSLVTEAGWDWLIVLSNTYLNLKLVHFVNEMKDEGT
jgi:hypothetical protein